ncbi:MAG TPA: C4-type zinc ribbon domain-containing protein [Propionibacteriaceae bacterium]|nr:C4-type zinc ribbon domain-containing protein [Propionibacteriaceae bacterium]
MQADPAAQRRLLELVAIDTQVAQLTHRRNNLPENAELAELRARHTEASRALVAAETRLSDAQREVQRVESDLVPARQRLVRDQERADQGAVTDPRALRGLLEEIEHLGGRIATLEDQELDHLQEVEDATADRDHLAAARDLVTARAREVIAARDQQVAEIDGRLAVARDARASLVAGLPADLVGLYDRIGARLGGAGAAELRAKRCLGCLLEINAADLRRFAAAAPEEVIRCEECDRILVRTPESGLS